MKNFKYNKKNFKLLVKAYEYYLNEKTKNKIFDFKDLEVDPSLVYGIGNGYIFPILGKSVNDSIYIGNDVCIGNDGIPFYREEKSWAAIITQKSETINLPIKGYYNHEKATTVLLFDDGERIITKGSESKESNLYNGIIIGLAKRILRADNESINKTYDQHGGDEKVALSIFYGTVLGYFLGREEVKNKNAFDKWIVNFMSNNVSVKTSEVKQKRKLESSMKPLRKEFNKTVELVNFLVNKILVNRKEEE